MTLITMVVADDHPLFLRGLEHGLQTSGLRVLAAVHDGAAAVSSAVSHVPDVVLMDVRMPVLDGIDACSQITRRRLSGAVVLISTWTDEATVRMARQAGARALLSKDARIEDLVEVVRHLHRDPTFEFFPEVLAPKLTDREFQVLVRLSQGFSRREIAADLGLSAETVKAYTTALFAKLDAHDKVTVVTRAVARGVLAIPPDGGYESSHR